MAQLLSSEVCPLLTEDVVAKLKHGGINAVRHLISLTSNTVAKRTNLPLSTIQNIQRALLARFGPHPISGQALLEEVEQNLCIFPFGLKSVDSLLKGGIYGNELTELWGPAASGKTRLCMSLMCGAVVSTPHTVAFVDGGGGSFNGSQLEHLLAAQGLKKNALTVALEKVRVFKVFSAFDLLSFFVSLHRNISQQANSFYANLRLVIIDPVTLFLAPLLGGQRGYSLMLQVSRTMRTLSSDHFIAVVYCNNVVTDMGGGLKPALGQTWSAVPSTRLKLSCQQPPHSHTKSDHIMTISKSPRLMVGSSATFSSDQLSQDTQ